MTREEINALPLPLDFMNGDERRLFDGLYDDLQTTISNLTRMVLANPKFKTGDPITCSINEYAPRFTIKPFRKNKDGWASVHYICERGLPGNPTTTIVCCINDDAGKEEFTIDGAPIESITAIVQNMIRIYRTINYGGDK